jgi:glycopeptide antibiotics resistance protein
MSDSASLPNSAQSPVSKPVTTVWAIAWRFAVLGPPVGSAILFAAIIFSGPGEHPAVFVFILFFGSLFGAIPAFIVGVCLAYLHKKLSWARSSSVSAALAATVLGALVGHIALFITSGGATLNTTFWSLISTLMGAAAALVCRLTLRDRFSRLPSA